MAWAMMPAGKTTVTTGFILSGVALMADQALDRLGPLAAPTVQWEIVLDGQKYHIQVTRVPEKPEG